MPPEELRFAMSVICDRDIAAVVADILLYRLGEGVSYVSDAQLSRRSPDYDPILQQSTVMVPAQCVPGLHPSAHKTRNGSHCVTMIPRVKRPVVEDDSVWQPQLQLRSCNLKQRPTIREHQHAVGVSTTLISRGNML
jgi:hypothetical protein